MQRCCYCRVVVPGGMGDDGQQRQRRQLLLLGASSACDETEEQQQQHEISAEEEKMSKGGPCATVNIGAPHAWERLSDCSMATDMCVKSGGMSTRQPSTRKRWAGSTLTAKFEKESDE